MVYLKMNTLKVAPSKLWCKPPLDTANPHNPCSVNLF